MAMRQFLTKASNRKRQITHHSGIINATPELKISVQTRGKNTGFTARAAKLRHLWGPFRNLVSSRTLQHGLGETSPGAGRPNKCRPRAMPFRAQRLA